MVLVVDRDVWCVLLAVLLVMHLVRRVRTITYALSCLGRVITTYLFETDSHDLTQTVRTKRLDISKWIVLRPLIITVHSLSHVEARVN